MGPGHGRDAPELPTGTAHKLGGRRRGAWAQAGRGVAFWPIEAARALGQELTTLPARAPREGGRGRAEGFLRGQRCLARKNVPLDAGPGAGEDSVLGDWAPSCPGLDPCVPEHLQRPRRNSGCHQQEALEAGGRSGWDPQPRSAPCPRSAEGPFLPQPRDGRLSNPPPPQLGTRLGRASQNPQLFIFKENPEFSSVPCR